MTNLPAPIYDGDVGFEDFDSSDMVMPLLRLNHQEGKLVDSLSGERFDELDVIMLGLIKQRIMWAPEVEEGKVQPLCRSVNATDGVPPDEAKFPWKASGFKNDDYIEGVPLPCESCKLKEWGTHPKNETSWCAEQYTFPLLIPTGDEWSPAIFTVQRSGLTAARGYMTSFRRSKSPMFTSFTHIGLDLKKRGTVTYAVPTYRKGAATDPAQHDQYVQTYLRIRQYVQTPRGTPVEEPVAAKGARGAAASGTDDIDFDEEF